MVIVYTYDKNVTKDTTKRLLLEDFYIESIKRVKALGHRVEIYTNSLIFNSYVDKVYIREWNNPVLWDSFKIFPLQERADDFLLLDGDVFFYSRLQIENKYDVIFDTYERGNWNLLYNKEVKNLTQLGIQTIIPEWDGKARDVMSCGILYFKEEKFRKLYVDRWLKVEKFIKSNIEKINLYDATAITSQYLLTTLCQYCNKKTFKYSEGHGVPNGYYVHYAGKDKFKGQTVKNLNKTLL